MILFSHPTGNANVREASRSLSDAGLLAEFWTTVSWNRVSWMNRALPSSVRDELARRAFPNLRKGQVHCHPWREIGRLATRKFPISPLTTHERGIFSLDSVWRSLDSRVATRLREVSNIRGIYAYEDGAASSFREARGRGVRTIYELPIGYWKAYREILNTENRLHPEWGSTLQGNLDSPEKLQRKDEELALADHIIVASSFVERTLSQADVRDTPITVVPYGAPATASLLAPKIPSREGNLSVIFVGALSQRKGISYLLQAVEQLAPRVSLTLVGRKLGECAPLDRSMLAHRWIPSLPHSVLLAEVARHDVMVFPSLFEGFGLVILEAMAQGVPVISTPNTAAPDIISDGLDGFIVPIRDVQAIVERLELLLADRNRLLAMREAAFRKAQLHSWENYRRRLVATVLGVLSESAPVHSATPRSLQPEVCASC